MASWTSLRDRLWGFISPRKFTTPGTTKSDPLHKVNAGRVGKIDSRRQSLSPSLQRYRRYLKVDEPIKEEYIAEEKEYSSEPPDEDELDEEPDSDAAPNNRHRFTSTTKIDEDTVEYSAEDESDTDSLDREEKEELDFAVERVAHATADDPDFADWTQGELDLHNRLNDRGVDPMLYSEWKMDFPTMPDALFTDEKEEAFIKALDGSEFRGSKALVNLLQVGNRVRDRSATRQDPAQVLAKTIKTYVAWSFKDAGLAERAYIPPITTMPSLGSETIRETVERMTLQLQELSVRYRDLYTSQPEVFEAEPLPTLYGIVIARTVMAFVTYDASQEEGDVRNLALFNWREEGQDVWNALAVAIMVMQAREWLINLNPLKDRSKLGLTRNWDADE